MSGPPEFVSRQVAALFPDSPPPTPPEGGKPQPAGQPVAVATGKGDAVPGSAPAAPTGALLVEATCAICGLARTAPRGSVVWAWMQEHWASHRHLTFYLQWPELAGTEGNDGRAGGDE